jgi:hypothetical protein
MWHVLEIDGRCEVRNAKGLNSWKDNDDDDDDEYVD